MWKKIFPPAEWLKTYNTKTLGSDVISGITLAAYGIPVSLAYATIAGLPPQYGIYGYLLGGLFYAMLGSGKQLAIGPTSAISLLIGTTIAGMANGDIQRWADIASLTALVFAVMAILSYLFKLSGIINFISETVLVGFKIGAAFTIALTQLPKLFGVPGGGESFFERLKILIFQLPDTNTSILIFGIIAIILLLLGEKFLPSLSIALVIVIISIVLITFTSVGLLGIKTVGFIPSGLPSFHMPSLRLSDVDGVLPLAFACFLLSYIESVSAGRTLAQKNGYEIDPRQELLALGVANAAVSLFQGYPVAGGLSQSAVNDKAGAKTPLSLVFASAAIALCLLFLTGTLENLPKVILASIVLVAIRGLVDIKAMKHLYKVDKKEFTVAMVALLAVIIFGILKGVIIGALVTILILIKATSHPHVAILGRIPGTIRFSDIEKHTDNEIIKGMLIVRIESSILYFNAENIRSKILAKLAEDASIKTVIFDMSSSPVVDISGARFFKRLYNELKAKGISLKIAEAHTEVRNMLLAEDYESSSGLDDHFVSVNDYVEAQKKELTQTKK